MPSDERIRVMIVDDHSIVRIGLKQILEQSGEFEVVGQAKDGEEAVRVAMDVSPDVVVMDVMLPGKDGITACREIKGAAPETRIAMLTVITDEEAVVNAVASGATGYLNKESDRDQLLLAMRDVANGELRIPAEVVLRVFAGLSSEMQAADTGLVPELTPREREILKSFAEGKSYNQIAQARAVKPVTIRNAVYGIQDKLGIRTMQGLVAWAIHNGLPDDLRTEKPAC